MVSSDGRKRTAKLWAGAAWLLIAWLGMSPARAADPSFVGVLALAVDKDVADRLGLSDEVRGKLRQLVNEREDAALEMVLTIKDLPPMEQTSRLTPFVAESERMGFALLALAQRERLQQIRLAREGMSALAEPGLSEALDLNGEQKAAVQKLLTQRAADMTKGGESERRITRAVYERQLAAILNDSQRAAWQKMAGLSDAPAAQARQGWRNQIARVPKPAKVEPPSAAAATTQPEMKTAVEAAVPATAPTAAPPVESAVKIEPQPAAAASAESAAKPEAKAVPETAEPAPTVGPAGESASKDKPQPAVTAPAESAAKPQMQGDLKAAESAPPAAPDVKLATKDAAAKAESQPAVVAPAESGIKPEMQAAPETANPFTDPSSPVRMPPQGATPEAAEPAAAPATPALAMPAPATDALPPDAPPTDAPPPAAVATAKSESESPAPASGRLNFQFDAAPWKDVLEWLAGQSGLSLAIETLPVGTFTYRDDRTYTVDEALDLLNSYLLTKGYTLVRRERILLVLDVENPIPEELVTLVTTDELDKRGRFELVKCLFPLARMKAEDAAAMIKDFIGPQGKVIPFPKARQILVTETAGKLRTIRDMITRVEDPTSGGSELIYEIDLKHASSEEVLSIARPLLGIPEGQNSAADISLSVDLLGTRIWATGSADKLQLLRELIPKIDKAPAETGEAAKEPEQLKLATYFIKAADAQVVLRVAQTLLADLPGVRLEVDVTSGKLIAWARPSEHRIIEETLKQLEGQDLQFEVIKLKRPIRNWRWRPSTSSSIWAPRRLRLRRMPRRATSQGPIVDGDPLTMQLWVRGTVLQIEQVKDLIEKLDGTETEEGIRGDHPHDPAVRGGRQIRAGHDREVLDAKEQDSVRDAVEADAVRRHQAASHHSVAARAGRHRTRTTLAAGSRGRLASEPGSRRADVAPPAGPAARTPAQDSAAGEKSAGVWRVPVGASPGPEPVLFVSEPKPADEPAGAARGCSRNRGRCGRRDRRRNPPKSASRLRPAASLSPRRTPRPWTSWRSCFARFPGPPRCKASGRSRCSI